MLKLPSQKKLKMLFSYDPESGIVIRKLKTGRATRVGTIVGALSHGYLTTRINKILYPLHRLIWIMHFGSINKSLQIDHINGERSDNKIKNLRLVTHKDNGRNTKMPNTNSSGVVGVFWNRRNKSWVASIYVDGKNRHIGCYSTIIDAVSARKASEREHGFHKNHGRVTT